MKTILNEVVEFGYDVFDDADLFEEYPGVALLVGFLKENTKDNLEKSLVKGAKYQIIIKKLD